MSTQALFVQVWFEAQQADPQGVGVAPVQPEVQAPPLQTWLAPQTLVQLPQWVASDATHEPLQSSSPDGHAHALF
jgi:hypothetical protein